MERNGKSGVIGVIITIIILVLLVVFTNRNTENISTIENFANVVIVPIQNGLTYLKNKINNNDKFFENVSELKTENEELKQKNSELEKSLREFEVMKTENEQLKQQLNLAEKYGEYTTVPGTIISRDISNYSKTLVINIGSDNGVKENMTVIADEGLVEQFPEIFPLYVPKAFAKTPMGSAMLAFGQIKVMNYFSNFMK